MYTCIDQSLFTTRAVLSNRIYLFIHNLLLTIFYLLITEFSNKLIHVHESDFPKLLENEVTVHMHLIIASVCSELHYVVKRWATASLLKNADKFVELFFQSVTPQHCICPWTKHSYVFAGALL